MSKLVKPGTDNEPSGKYIEVNEKGEEVSSDRVVNIASGDRLPPTSKSGNRWKKVE